MVSVEPPGTYVLILHLSGEASISIGRLGTFGLPVGYYLYVGSARGPGGLRARLQRHLRREKPQHWHIDYLLSVSNVVEVWSTVSPRRLECLWAQVLLKMPGASTPALRFGSSDCGCPTHLIHFTSQPSLQVFGRHLRASGLGHRLCTDFAGERHYPMSDSRR
jgi:Uri superfamily endonuclease